MTWILLMFVTTGSGYKIGVRFDDTNYKSKAACEAVANKHNSTETDKLFSYGCIKGNTDE